MQIGLLPRSLKAQSLNNSARIQAKGVTHTASWCPYFRCVGTPQSRLHRVFELTSSFGRQQKSSGRPQFIFDNPLVEFRCKLGSFQSNEPQNLGFVVASQMVPPKGMQAKLAMYRACATSVSCTPRRRSDHRRQSPSRRLEAGRMDRGVHGGILIKCLHTGGAMSSS